MRRATCITTTITCTVSFLSTLSLRRATENANNSSNANLHFYPRSPCGERQLNRPAPLTSGAISIHALLAESDTAFDVLAVSALLISIHALLAESDELVLSLLEQLRHFYPRSPCGERPPGFHIFRWSKDFYPRSPCGERLCSCGGACAKLLISIHALLAESDNCQHRSHQE